MKVLIACEHYGVVRDAFNNLGHDAWSCDLLPGKGRWEKHYQMDVIELLKDSVWDLIIAHPPCTRLCNSGVLRLYKNGKKENGVELSGHILLQQSPWRNRALLDFQ